MEEWYATEDTCSFKVKGFTVKLRMIDKVEGKHVKITGDDGGVPIDFSFWIQLHEVTPTDVGSSPKIIGGLVIKALAIATLCC